MMNKIRYWPVTVALLLTTVGGVVSFVIGTTQDNRALKDAALGVLTAAQALMAVVLPRFTVAWRKVKDLTPGAVDLLDGKVQP